MTDGKRKKRPGKENTAASSHIYPLTTGFRDASLGSGRKKNQSNITLLYLEKRNKGSELQEHTHKQKFNSPAFVYPR